MQWSQEAWTTSVGVLSTPRFAIIGCMPFSNMMTLFWAIEEGESYRGGGHGDRGGTKSNRENPRFTPSTAPRSETQICSLELKALSQRQRSQATFQAFSSASPTSSLQVLPLSSTAGVLLCVPVSAHGLLFLLTSSSLMIRSF